MVSVRGGLIDVIKQMDKFLCCEKNFMFIPWFVTRTDGGGGGRIMIVILRILCSWSKPVLYSPTAYTYLCAIH
jgi:hypothetical protein